MYRRAGSVAVRARRAGAFRGLQPRRDASTYLDSLKRLSLVDQIAARSGNLTVLHLPTIGRGCFAVREIAHGEVVHEEAPMMWATPITVEKEAGSGAEKGGSGAASLATTACATCLAPRMEWLTPGSPGTTALGGAAWFCCAACERGARESWLEAEEAAGEAGAALRADLAEHHERFPAAIAREWYARVARAVRERCGEEGGPNAEGRGSAALHAAEGSAAASTVDPAAERSAAASTVDPAAERSAAASTVDPAAERSAAASTVDPAVSPAGSNPDGLAAAPTAVPQGIPSEDLPLLCYAKMETPPAAWVEFEEKLRDALERAAEVLLVKKGAVDATPDGASAASAARDLVASVAPRFFACDAMARLHVNAFRIDTVTLPNPHLAPRGYANAVSRAFAQTADGGNGTGVFALASMFNHSCDPTCEVGWTHNDARMRIVTRREVAKGEQLTISYIDLEDSGPVRREKLRHAYGFVCNCQRCQSGE